jgi:hypothetical protein
MENLKVEVYNFETEKNEILTLKIYRKGCFLVGENEIFGRISSNLSLHSLDYGSFDFDMCVHIEALTIEFWDIIEQSSDYTIENYKL